MKKFKVYAEYKNKKLHYWVKVFDTRTELINEAKKKDIWRKQVYSEEWYQESVGMCQKWECLENDKQHPWIGQILLTKDECPPNVVYHEVVHAALWAYELLHTKSPLFSQTKKINSEEKFAYLYGDMLSMMVSKLYKHKIW